MGVSVSVISTAARAEQLPLWELGAGPAGISFPQYRGSDERTNYVLPAPYFVYRGEFLKADRQRVRGLFYKSEYAEVDISTSGSVPVKSKDNRARTGMPDLDPSLELGPSLSLSLDRSADGRRTLEVRLPLRVVLASDFKRVHYEGWLFQPQLNWDNADFMGTHGLNLGLVVGPVFGSAKYHQYFYKVDPAFATPTRPAYQAHGGYGGTQFIGALSRRFSDFWVGGFVKYDYLRGAAFDDSPLTRSKSGVSAGLAVLWVFAESKTKVEAQK
jgi:outer membrane scaffolding protein for murein synthesis (MipA/OmpV family)